MHGTTESKMKVSLLELKENFNLTKHFFSLFVTQD
jgi:hypothetical protein